MRFKSFLFFFIFFVVCNQSVFSQINQTQKLKSETSSFIVSYSHVPDSVIPVIDFVTQVLSSYINSSIPITVHVAWSELSEQYNAYAKPSTYYQNIDGLPYNDVLYPAALAEKIIGRNLNFQNSDIDVVINSNINWQLDYLNVIDSDKTDLATILMHEFVHGLGMLGNFTYQNGLSSLIGSPTIFDLFVSYDNTISVVDMVNKYTISQDSLTKILTSNSLFWSGKYTSSLLGFSPHLYAPNTYNSGSSVYHFDEAFLPEEYDSTLMKYIITKGERILIPDIATLLLLADLGWNDYFVSHEKLSNISDISQQILFELTCIDTLFDVNTHKLLYSLDNGKHYQQLALTYDAGNNNYSVLLPSFPFEHTITYSFLSVTENEDSLYIPVEFPSNAYKIFVGEDVEGPKIEHVNQTRIPFNYENIEFTANITDNFELDSAYIQFIIGRNEFASILGTGKVNFQYNNSLYIATLNLSGYNLQEGDAIAYNIIAVDKSSNVSYNVPLGEYVFISVEAVQDPIDYFISDFESDTISDYFNLDKFSISLEDGFTNKALHSNHPYVSSFIDGKYVNSIAELIYPIRIAQNPAIMEFDEVVLVEPGEFGVEYGMYGFWDFVVVEGTKDKKTNVWYPLGKVGYDSRLHDTWLETFYSSITPENNNSSSALGNESMYINHTINLLENKYFRVGDTVYIRFRLQSDYDVHGWGWSIDNLKIQERIALEITKESDVDLFLYPNPCKNKLYISKNDGLEQVQIFNSLGKLQSVNVCENEYIILNSLHAGFYYMKLFYVNGEIKTKTFIKQ